MQNDCRCLNCSEVCPGAVPLISMDSVCCLCSKKSSFNSAPNYTLGPVGENRKQKKHWSSQVGHVQMSRGKVLYGPQFFLKIKHF